VASAVVQPSPTSCAERRRLIELFIGNILQTSDETDPVD
jgi:hypothetical protein